MSLIIEDENGWGVSFTSHNPEPSDFIQCASYEDAEKLHSFLDWRPIETAPKNCIILLGRAGYPCVNVGQWSDRFSHWSIGPSPMDFFSEPTHWKPQPEAPLAATRSSDKVSEIFPGTLDALSKLGA